MWGQSSSSRIVVIGVIIIIALIGFGHWAWVPPNVANANCQVSQNAAWISVDWTSKPVDVTDVQHLAEGMTAHHIRYVFPFTTYVKPDGTFNDTYAYAGEFVTAFRAFNQDVYVLAWVGIPLKNERQIGIEGWVDLADEEEREQIVTFVTDLVQEAGFDGVHLDVETVQDGDPEYLKLLEEVKHSIGEQVLLSVSGSYWLPEWVNRLPVVNGYKWSIEYYQDIAKRVDQIGTMTYDSLMPHPALYRLWMREEVRGISEGLKETDVELLIGVSVSKERSMTHHPYAENLQNGLSGACAYMSRGDHNVQGMAIYAAWEMASEEWQIWDRVLEP